MYIMLLEIFPLHYTEKQMYDSTICLAEEKYYIVACFKHFHEILAVPILAVYTISLQHFVAYKLLILISNHCVYIL